MLKFFKTTNGLGGAVTAAESISATLNDIFDRFTGKETTDGGVFYACVYLKNDHATDEAVDVESFIETETAHAGVNISLAKGSSAINAEEQTIANENTAPAGVVFEDTDTTNTGEAVADIIVSLGNIPAQETGVLWLRVTIDSGVLEIEPYDVDIKTTYG